MLVKTALLATNNCVYFAAAVSSREKLFEAIHGGDSISHILDLSRCSYNDVRYHALFLLCNIGEFDLLTHHQWREEALDAVVQVISDSHHIIIMR